MDPNAAYLGMANAFHENDHEPAREFALMLKDWLRKGGFYPPNRPKLEVDTYIKHVLRVTDYLVED